MDSLRIGIVCYPTYGGSGAVATELGRLLARRGHTIHFISYARPFRLMGDFHENIFHHEISSESYPLFQGQLYTIAAAVKMLDIVKTVGIDLLHLHYALPHAISAFLAREMLGNEHAIPVLTTLHGTDITLAGSKPSFLPAVRLGLDKSDRLTAVSRWLAERTCKTFGLNDPIEVIPNFVDPEVFKPQVSGCHRSHYASPDEKIIMHISNFRPVKRVTDVVGTFARICEHIPARLIMIGDGPDREAAQLKANELGVADRVTMLGMQSGVEHFLSVADLFLFPSDSESFGLAALEAMACGVPVVGSAAGGLTEVVAEGETGHLCPVGDLNAFAKASLSILEDPEKLQTMREANRRRVLQEFSSDRIIPVYESLYHRVLNGNYDDPLANTFYCADRRKWVPTKSR